MGKTSKRLWKIAKESALSCRLGGKRIQKRIKEQTKTKKRKTKKVKPGLNSVDIVSALNCFPHFIGCVAENEIDELVFGRLPCFIVVNVDSSNLPGSHWISLGIFPKSIEIFDPLGFDIFNWSRIPCSLLKFLHRMSVTRKVVVGKRIQSNKSKLCGFYCLFYIFMRRHASMKHLMSYFDSKLSRNDSVLVNFFS